MRFFFDFFPILLFFLAFKWAGIYVATAITMLASILQVAVHFLRHRSFEILHFVTLFTVLILGSTTLLLHNELFIKWKPTVIYWIFALVFLASRFVGKKPLVQRMLSKQIQLPQSVWYKLNILWVVFFAGMGCLNVYVVYHFDTNTWVNFKLFGTLAISFVFLILQAIYLHRSGSLERC